MRSRVMKTGLFAAALTATFQPYGRPQSGLATSNATMARSGPAFTVATVKPSDPHATDWALGIKGNHFFSTNTNVDDLISFAYEVHAKQIVGGPAWLFTDKFDTEAVPDIEGKPNREQLETIARDLLVDRFKLVVHHDRRELAVYVLTVGKNGPKLAKSGRQANESSGYGFGPLGTMNVQNMTMAAFSSAMQRTVLDKPLIDRTGLTDRYDFVLKWTPDESQFLQLRAAVGPKAPHGSDDPNSPPELYTAIQEQLGLKLQPVKTRADVIVIDHVERPLPN